MRLLLSLVLSAVCAVPCLIAQGVMDGGTARSASTPEVNANPNILTPQEADQGWRLLFDGTSFDGWRLFRKASVESDRWIVEDGCLHLYGRSPERRIGGDLISTETFGNFEFAFEWLAAPGMNSGVKYLIDEYFAPNRAPVSFEYQIQIEEDPAAPRRKPVHSTGALYDMIPPKAGILRPAGSFNESRILVQGTHVEHWLNGEKVVEFDRAAPAFRELVAKSKFSKWPGFGLNERGHIGLQDHGAEVWFRRLRLRPLPSPRETHALTSSAGN